MPMQVPPLWPLARKKSVYIVCTICMRVQFHLNSPWLSSLCSPGRFRRTVRRYLIRSEPQHGFSANHRTFKRLKSFRYFSSDRLWMLLRLKYSSLRCRHEDMCSRDEILLALTQKRESLGHYRYMIMIFSMNTVLRKDVNKPQCENLNIRYFQKYWYLWKT